jgi:acyl dehydratase
MGQLPLYQIRAVNDAATSENKIHSDEIAQRFGFTGALVSGVSVFGYLTHPLVEAYGEDWLTSGIADVKFIKPAYVDDLLSIKAEVLAESARQRHCVATAHNETGDLLARLESWRPQSETSIRSNLEPNTNTTEILRDEISIERIKLNQSAPDYNFVVEQTLHQGCLEIMRDDLAVYHQASSALIHPYYLLKECNHALMRMFILPAWIHVGSTMVFHCPVKVSQIVTVRTTPIEKWKTKGHQFIKLNITMIVEEKRVLEVEHTAIFRISSS